MKVSKIIMLALAALTTLSACDKGKSYAELLSDENKAVNRFLINQRVELKLPKDNNFEVGPEAPYYRLDDEGNIFMQVLDRGSDVMAEKDQLIYYRFMRYNLENYNISSTKTLTENFNISQFTPALPTSAGASEDSYRSESVGVNYVISGCWSSTAGDVTSLMMSAEAYMELNLNNRCNVIRVTTGAQNSTAADNQLTLSVGDKQLAVKTVNRTSATYEFELPKAYRSKFNRYRFTAGGSDLQIARIAYVVVDEFGDGEGNEDNPASAPTSFRFENFSLPSSSAWGSGIQMPLYHLGIGCEVNLVIKSQYGWTSEVSNVKPYLYHIRYNTSPL